MIDFVVGADLLVENAASAAAQLVEVLGLPDPKPSWRQRPPGWGFDAIWLRVGRTFTESPTRLEVIAPSPDLDERLPHPHIAAIAHGQARRTPKTHATPLAVEDVAAIARHLSDVRVPFRLDAPHRSLPFPRLWVGHNDQDATEYDPAFDSWLRIECIPTAAVGTHPRAAPPSTARPTCGEPTRVAAKVFLVPSRDGAVAVIERTMPWFVITTWESDRGKVASLRSATPESATIELLEPPADSLAGERLREDGPGPYAIRLVVDHIGERRRILDANRSPYGLEDHGDLGVTLCPSPPTTLGMRFELVER